MSLSPPSFPVLFISILLGVAGIAAQLGFLGVLEYGAFWLLAAGHGRFSGMLGRAARIDNNAIGLFYVVSVPTSGKEEGHEVPVLAVALDRLTP